MRLRPPAAARLAALAAVTCGVVGARPAAAAPVNELTVAAGVDSAFDDNVYNGRGPDWVNRVTPRAGWRLRHPRITVDTEYQFGYWTYAFGKAKNSLNHYARAGFDWKLTRRLTIGVGNELIRAQDPGFLPRVGVVAPQIGITQDLTEANIGYAASRRVFLSARYQLVFALFDPYDAMMVAAGLPALFNGAEHDADAGARIRLGRHDALQLGFRYQHFTAGPQAGSFAAWALADTYSPTAGWEHHFTPSITLGADAGPLFFQALDGAVHIPTATNESGVTWRLAARLRWLTPTWSASLNYGHDLVGATGAGSALWVDHVYGQVTYHMGTRLDAHVGAGYFQNGRAVSQPYSYQGVTVDALLDVSIIQYLRIGAYYTLRHQVTGAGAVPGANAFPDVTRDVVGVRLLAIYGADARPPRREVH